MNIDYKKFLQDYFVEELDQEEAIEFENSGPVEKDDLFDDWMESLDAEAWNGIMHSYEAWILRKINL